MNNCLKNKVVNKYLMARKICLFRFAPHYQMTLKLVKPRFARLLNPHINTTPSFGFNFVDRKELNSKKVK